MSKRSEREHPKHIVVVGAGQIGTPLVARLAKDGHKVTWCSRTRPESMPMGVEHVSLDARDGAAAHRGADRRDHPTLGDAAARRELRVGQ